MKAPDRALFVDANVLVSAVLFHGPEERLVHLAHGGSVRLQTSAYVLEQVRRVLAVKFALPADRVDQAIDLLPVSVVPEAGESALARAHGLLRDPSDAPVLAAAWDCGAAVLVTGDRDLLDLGGNAGLPICRASQLWAAPPGATDPA